MKAHLCYEDERNILKSFNERNEDNPNFSKMLSGLDEDEQAFLTVFSNLSESESIKVFEKCIRDEQDDDVRKVMRFLFSMYQETCRESHG